MKLQVLGCHGPYPMAGGATSGYLLQKDGQQLLMDCGSGVLSRLMQVTDPAELQGVLLSHLHFDHAADMPVLGYYLQQRGVKMPIFVPEEDESPLRRILESSGVFEVQPYPEMLCLCGLEISVFPVRHPVPCRAIRIKDGEKTLVFTGDTNVCPGLAKFAENADVLMADAAFLEAEWQEKLPHLSAKKAAELAVAAGAKRFYLTHLPVRHEAETMVKEAKEVYEQAQAVTPGMVIQL